MRLTRFAAVAAAAATFATAGVALVSGSAAADPGCPNVDVVAIPGTWETGIDRNDELSGTGMLGGVTRGLPGSENVDYVDYAATAFPWEGAIYGDSERQAVDNARGIIADVAFRCPATRFAIVGYSQGAHAAGDLAADIGTGLSVVPPSRIAAVGLISDPRRAPSDPLVGPPVGGAGAAGPRVGGFGFVSDRVRTVCAPNDLYCSTDNQDFVTRFAGFLAQSSDRDPAKLWRYQLEAASIIGDLMANGGIATLQSQLSEDANKDRVEQLQQFYQSGSHAAYGAYQVGGGESAVSWMHDWIASMG